MGQCHRCHRRVRHEYKAINACRPHALDTVPARLYVLPTRAQYNSRRRWYLAGLVREAVAWIVGASIALCVLVISINE